MSRDQDELDAAPRALLGDFMGLMHRQRLLLHRALLREDIHPAQAQCLRVLGHRDEVTQSELAETMFLTRPSVTRIVQRMERSGLVWRRTDRDDQRLTRVGLTDAGRALQHRLESVMKEYMDATLARLPENDRRELARLLRTWRELADEVLGEPSGGTVIATSHANGTAAHCPPRGSTG